MNTNRNNQTDIIRTNTKQHWCNKMNYINKFLLTSLLCIGLTACFPTAPEDDESNASFAREIIPTLLGRKATSVNEIEAVADIAELLGRETAVRMLMEEEDYVDHMADMLIDVLKMQRQANNDGVNAAQDDTCWGDPTTDEPDPSIAEWVRDHDPQDAGAPTGWNMTDLVRSAIAIDDISTIYKAYLFPLSMRRDSFMNNNGNLRDSVKASQLTERLLTVYLNRDTTCLRCHNPTFSTSNVTDSNGTLLWQRLYSISGHAEKALFNNYYDSVGAFDNVVQVMRGSVRQTEDSGVGILPWGMELSCATDTNSALPSNNGTVFYTGFKNITGGGSSVKFGSLDGSIDPDVSLWELERSLHQGIEDLKDGYDRFTATSVILPADEQDYCDAVDVFSSSCVGCHSGGSPSGGLDLSSDPHGELVGVATQAGSSIQGTRVVANNQGNSELWSRINSANAAYQMPPGGGLSQGDKDSVSNWINSGAVGIDIANCNTSSVPDVAPDEAFAFLTAANAVDGIWESIMGYRLTIDHGFSRNKQQRDMLQNLTEFTFLPEDWSLKAVLTKILVSDWYARRAPSLSQLDSAYPLYPILDPWSDLGPIHPNPTDAERKNGKGEQVERYRVNTLLRSIADALGWEEPRRFKDSNYPTNFDEDIGQYRSPTVAGFDSINFQSLLALEAEVGLCEKSGKSVNADDWIDLVSNEISTFNAANPDAPITIGEAWSILKDRLIQDTTIQRDLPQELQGVVDAMTEESAVVALFNEGLGTTLTLNSSTGELSSNNLESKLREGCGVLMKTSFFLLDDISSPGYSDNNMPDAPRLNVCLDGQNCSYANACGHWRGVLHNMGEYIACEDRTVREAELVFFPWTPPGGFTTRPFEPLDPGPFTPVFTNPIDPILKPNVDLSRLKIDRAQLSEKTLKQAEFDIAYQVRSQSLCPEGLCGFVREPSVQECVDSPKAAACRRIVASCDPRAKDTADYCGNKSADIRDEGVHVLWGDGAIVQAAEGITILRPTTSEQKSKKIKPFKVIDKDLLKRKKVKPKKIDRKEIDIIKPKLRPIDRDIKIKPIPVGSRLSKQDLTKLQRSPTGPLSGKDLSWKKLRKGEKLRAGDLVNIPLSGFLTLKYKNKIITTGEPIKQRSNILRGNRKISGHIVSITGPSAEKLLIESAKKGTLSVAELKRGYINGRYESKAPTKQQWARLKRLGAKPNSRYIPDLKQLEEATLDYNSQHIIDDPRFTPEGNDNEKYDRK